MKIIKAKRIIVCIAILSLCGAMYCLFKPEKEDKSTYAEMQLFEYLTQYAQVSGNHFYYLRKNEKNEYILHQDGKKEILSFHLSKQKLRGFVVWQSQYYLLVRNEVGTLQFGKVGKNNEVNILCDVYAQKEICSIILHGDSLFVCEYNSDKIERQSMKGETRTPVSLDVALDGISLFGSEEMDGICAMNAGEDGKMEIVFFDWQGNRKRTLHSQIKPQDNSKLARERGIISFDKIIDKYICFTYYCGGKCFAGKMHLDGNRAEVFELGSVEICDTSFTKEGVYFISQNRTIYYKKWGKNKSEKISDLQAESIDAVGKWLYVKGYAKEWEMLEDGEEEASDEWSDELYRIRCNDGKIEKIEEGKYAIEE